MKYLLSTCPNPDVVGDWATCFPPLGLLSCASVLEEHNHEVNILDATAQKMDVDQTAKTILDYEPDYLCLSILSVFRHNALDVINQVKAQNSNIKIAIGGAHVSPLAYEYIKRYPQIDYAIIGEGENVLSTLPLLKKRSVVEAEFIKDLDLQKFPARHLVDMKGYFQRAKEFEVYKSTPTTTLMTARGCVNKCTFCSSCQIFPTYRRRSAKNVVDEIEFLGQQYGVKDIHFFDDTFNSSEKWLTDFSNELKQRKLEIDYQCLVRAVPNKNSIKVMADSGCYHVSMGIESGSEDTLKSIKKNISLIDVVKTRQLFKENNITCKGFFMLGFPNETKWQMDETFYFAKRLGLDDLAMSVAMIFPGSELAKDFDVNKWFDVDYNPGTLGYTQQGIPNCRPLERFELERQVRIYLEKLGVVLPTPKKQESIFDKVRSWLCQN